MGKTTSAVARGIRLVRPAARPVKVVARKASAFADKVSMDLVEQDQKTQQRKVLIETARSIRKWSESVKTEIEARKPKSVKPSGKTYSIDYYTTKVGVATDESMLLAEGFEYLLRTMAYNRWRPNIELTTEAGNFVTVPWEGEPKKFLLGGGDFSEMLTNIQLHLADVCYGWAIDESVSFNRHTECWTSMDHYNLWANRTNAAIESCESLPKRGNNITFIATFLGTGAEQRMEANNFQAMFN